MSNFVDRALTALLASFVTAVVLVLSGALARLFFEMGATGWRAMGRWMGV